MGGSDWDIGVNCQRKVLFERINFLKKKYMQILFIKLKIKSSMALFLLSYVDV